MTLSWTRKPIVAGLGLAATLLLAVGCGSKQENPDEIVVVTEPGVNVPTAGTSSTSAPASATTTPAASTPAVSSPAAAPTKAEGWGTIKGQVTFNGSPPAPKELVAKGQAPKDPTVCGKEGPIPSERLVIDGGSKGVKNVLVYFSKPTAVNEEAKSAAQQNKFEFDQHHCVFEPHVLAIMTGATVVLKNSDPVNHNINSRLKNSGFNKLLSGSQSADQKVDAPERTPGELTCDIHPWMKAYWMILDHPYFAVTDAKGNFEIKNVPAGTQKIVVWQEAVGFVTPPSGETINIKAGDSTSKDFKIDAGKVKAE